MIFNKVSFMRLVPMIVFLVSCSNIDTQPDTNSWSLTETALNLHPVLSSVTEEQDLAHGHLGMLNVVDNTVLMYDHSLGQVRVLDQNWETVHRIQRPGSGPCEFRSVTHGERMGDKLLVHDMIAFKIIIYDLSDGPAYGCSELMYDAKTKRIIDIAAYDESTGEVVVLAGEREGSTVYALQLTNHYVEELAKIEIPEYRDDPEPHPIALSFRAMKQGRHTHLFPVYYSGWSLKYDVELRSFTRIQHHAGAGPGYEYSIKEPEGGPLYVRGNTAGYSKYWLSINHGYGFARNHDNWYYIYLNRSLEYCPAERCFFADTFDEAGNYLSTTKLYAGSFSDMPKLPDSFVILDNNGRFLGYDYQDSKIVQGEVVAE